MNKNRIAKAMPTVLFITGIAGIFVSEVLCAKGALKADKIKRERYCEAGPEEEKELTKKEKIDQFIAVEKNNIQMTWKCYIPTAVSTSLTLAALIASNRLTAKQIALLSSAVAGAGSLVTKYRDEIRERFDEEVLHDIDRKVAQDSIPNAKPPRVDTCGLMSSESIDLSDDREYVFYDPFTNIKFRSTKLAVRGAKYYLNRNFAMGGLVGLGMFYNFLGMELPEAFAGCEWDANVMCEDGYYWIDIDIVQSTEPDPETGEKYYILEYGMDPGECEDSYYLYGNPVEMEGSHARA